MSHIKQPQNENGSGIGTTRSANGLSHADASNNQDHFTLPVGKFTVKAQPVQISEAERRRRLAAAYDVLLEAAENCREQDSQANHNG